MIPNYIIFLINNLQLTMYNYFQLSIVNCQLSTVNCQLSQAFVL